jgi:hypothetical protein
MIKDLIFYYIFFFFLKDFWRKFLEFIFFNFNKFISDLFLSK